MMVTKDNDIVLYEFKLNAKSVSHQVLNHMLDIVNMLRNRNPELNIDARIAAPGKFNSRIVKVAEDHGITLIDGNNFIRYF